MDPDAPRCRPRLGLPGLDIALPWRLEAKLPWWAPGCRPRLGLPGVVATLPGRPEAWWAPGCWPRLGLPGVMATPPWRPAAWGAPGCRPRLGLPGVVTALPWGLETALPWKPVAGGPITWRWLTLGLPGAAMLGLTARRPKPGLEGVLVPTVLWRACGLPGTAWTPDALN